MPAANISVLNNEIHCADYMTVFNLGATGAQGSVMNSNIVIAGNSIYAPTKLAGVFGFGGSGINGVIGLTICNNHISVPQQIFAVISAGPQQSKVIYSNNVIDCPSSAFQTGAPGANNAPFVLVSADSPYTAQPIYHGSVQTNRISYAGGPKQRMDFVPTGDAFVLDDSTPRQIPAGAYLEFDNRANRWASFNGGTGGDVIVFPSVNPTSSIAVAYGQLVTFYWNGTAWNTNAPTTASGNGGGTTNPPTAHTPPPGFHVGY